MCIIMEMKQHYVDSTMTWIKRTFDREKHKFAYTKLKEFEARGKIKNNT